MEMNTCSTEGVYISPQIRILHTKRSFLINLKENQNLQLQYIFHAFSIQQTAMFVYGSIEDHMFDFLTGFF